MMLIDQFVLIFLIQSFVIMNIKKQRADILNLTRCDKSIIY